MGVEIPGSTTVDTRVDIYRGFVALRPGGRFVDIVSIEGIFGVGVDSTEAKLRSPGFDLSEEKTGVGFVIGARLSVRPIPLFDLYAQVNAMIGHYSSSDFEVGWQLNLTPNLGVYGGYRTWTYNEARFRARDPTSRSTSRGRRSVRT